MMEQTAEKAIITVVGKDTIGIIAKVSTYLSESRVNILDISQTIVSGYFQYDDDRGRGGYGRNLFQTAEGAGGDRGGAWRFREMSEGRNF